MMVASMVASKPSLDTSCHVTIIITLLSPLDCQSQMDRFERDNKHSKQCSPNPHQYKEVYVTIFTTASSIYYLLICAGFLLAVCFSSSKPVHLEFTLML